MWKEWIAKWGKKHAEEESGSKPLGPLRWSIIIAGAGVVIMLFSSMLTVEEVSPPPEPTAAEGEGMPASGAVMPRDPISDYALHYQEQLKEMIEQIVGVGTVEVFVNMASGKETVYQKNIQNSESRTEEKDQHQATRNIVETSKDEQVVLHRSENSEEPLVVKELTPAVKGVLVVAEGAENLQVKAWIIEAVQKSLDLPAHRVSVLPRKREGG